MKNKYKGFLIDMDGTLYRGNERIPEAEYFVNRLIAEEIPFQLVTNNATKSVDEIKQRLNDYYAVNVETHHIYTSILALGDYLEAHYKGANVYFLAEDAVKTSITSRGFCSMSEKPYDVVVQALKRDVVYEELREASQAILNGADFITTNTDRLIPTENGFIPSSGAIHAFISYATNVQAKVMGKPHAPIMEGALNRLGFERQEVLMIGDNYDTDILAGINQNIDTLLVLTGITSAEEIENLTVKPNYVMTSLSEWKW